MRGLYFISVFGLFLLINTGNLFAEEIYIIKKGDNLYALSKRFGVDAERIKAVNKLESTRLKPGIKLTIPTGESKTRDEDSKSAADISAKESSPKNTDGSNADAAPYHIVKKGDTLVSISKKYSIPVKELSGINSIKGSAKLKIGQHIAVKKTGPKTYTVKKGDNIWKIAKRAAISVEEIVELNELETIKLNPGQKLVLEAWEDSTDEKTHTVIISQAKLVEDIKTLSESSVLESMGLKERSILFAKKMLHIPYRFGGSTLMGIDCSAFVQRVYSLVDVTLPRTAREQFSKGEPVSREDLSIGDLVFFRTYASFPSHVGIYLGNNLFIHASSKGRKVTINNLDTPYYFKRFIGAKRLLFDNETKKEKDTQDTGG